MKLSLGFKLSFAIMLVLIVETMVALVLIKNNTQDALKNIINEEFSQTINVIENTFSFMEQSNIYMANSFIKSHKDLKNINLEKNRRELKVDSLILVNKNADIISQAGLFRVNAQNLKSYHIVHEVIRTKTPMSAIERVGDIFVFYTASPIIKNNKLFGVMLIGLQISNRVLSEMHKGSSIHLAIVGDRAIGASSLKLKNGKDFVLLPVDYMKYLMLLNKKIEFLITKIDGREYFLKAKDLKYVDTDTTNASLMLLYDTKIYHQQLQKIKNIQDILIAIMIVSLFITVIILSWYLRKNFRKLINGLKSISKGEYGKKVDIKTNDELETLAFYFNQMSLSIKEKDSEIQRHLKNLEDKIKNITQLKKTEKILYKKATIDSLTGLYNRDKFNTMYNFILSLSKRENKKVGFAIVDIDFFKAVNDTYGHLVGDAILKEIANILQNSIRENDIVARWGGEEFVIALLVHNVDEAKAVIEKIRAKIQQHKFVAAEELTCSFGLTLSRYEEDKNVTFQRADEALYKAKMNGRNRVEVEL